MKVIAVLFALGLVAGCQPRAGAPQESVPAALPPSSSLAGRLTAHAWSGTDGSSAPGTLRIFTADGTLLMDSCFETYRLSRWSMESDSVVFWQEDGADIRATVVAVDAEQLVLRLALVGGDQVEQRYRSAIVPFTCPDMPRQ